MSVMQDCAGVVDGDLDAGADANGAILIIEDCEPLLFYLNTALLTLGYKNQHLAANLAEAKAVWAQHKESISHIVLNYELPDGLGFDFATAVTRERTDINIVVTTGYDLLTVRESPGASDRYQFLQKPFRLLELKAAMAARALDRTFSM